MKRSALVIGKLVIGHFPSCACTNAASSSIVFETGTPACENALIFDAAVPLPPETIAPAWPIVFPGGANAGDSPGDSP